MFANELARRSAEQKCIGVLVADPRISRGTPPSSTTTDLSEQGLRKLIHRLCDLAARLVPKKTSSATLFCSVADPSIMELPMSSQEMEVRKSVLRAPIYQDLRLRVSSTMLDQADDEIKKVAQLLWNISEKWTRLDAYPTALPLPRRLTET